MRSRHRPKQYGILPCEVWAEVRRQYIAGIGPAELCRRFGVARSTLTTKRARERWDDQRAAAQRLRNECISASTLTDRSESGRALGSSPQLMVSDEGDPQQLNVRTAGWLPSAVRTGAEPENSIRIGATNDAYFKLAGALRRRIDLLVAEQALGTSPSARPSRDLLDAASALEKLQRVERLALGLNDREPATKSSVVILVPSKLTPEEWQRQAQQLGGRQVEYEEPELRPSTAEGDGHREEHDVWQQDQQVRARQSNPPSNPCHDGNPTAAGEVGPGRVR